jgi:hypothetical protein
MRKLLTRDEFRNGVFARDRKLCVVCGEPAVDAHHIMERRLFNAEHEFGGYFLDNGASLCGSHHIAAEETFFSVEAIMDFAGIKQRVTPEHLYDDQIYDKWGNPIVDGMRMKGELFYDESVQKILKKAGALALFGNYVKYPRTYHLPWSLGKNDDDKNHTSDKQWEGMEVVVTVKMDGENTTMYNDYIHARSIDSRNHPSRNWVKNYWSTIAHDIPFGWRVCGENLYAKHSIGYTSLLSYFNGFSIWNSLNECLSWDDSLEWFKLLGITPVQEMYRGPYDRDAIQQFTKQIDFSIQEGYVLRPTNGFAYKDFSRLVGKFVRPNHVQTTVHWFTGSNPEVNECIKS